MTRLWQLSTALLHRWAALLIPLSLLLSAAASVASWQAMWDTRAEADAREAASCDQAHAIRAEQEQLLLDIAVDLDASPRILDLVRRRFEQLPEPASCQP